MRNNPLALTAFLLLGACAAVPQASPQPGSRPAQTSVPAPMRPPPQVVPAPPSNQFRPPQVMRLPGLEQVIGSSASELERKFGKAQLDVTEGDARKLQFSDTPCVLDVYLYPLRPGAAPSATHVEARRASDGRAVDRAACVRALTRQ